jgi:hypothetical protein
MKAAVVASVLVVAGLTGCGNGTVASTDSLRSSGAPAPGMRVMSVAAPAAAAEGSGDLRRERGRLTQPIALPHCTTGVSPHFDTPEASMRYLAAAWNRDDLDALCAVTNPNARLLLLNMHAEAVNLQLQRCKQLPDGSYECTFTHDFPTIMHRHGKGHAWFRAAPADRPGWYMTIFEGCGG